VAIISDSDQQFIRDHFTASLTGPVTVTLHTRPRGRVYVPGREECMYCEETQQLLEEVAALSDHITLDVRQAADGELVPRIEYAGLNKGTLRFFGIPAGNEFRNLIDTIVEVGSGEANLAPETSAALAALEQDVHIKVFVTPT
jgi:alkyl hydroperoxide reductase subunit AhpF